MMFGLRDEFAYVRCEDCGCLQIEEFPSDLARFYPDNYYSKSVAHPRSSAAAGLARRSTSWLRLHLLNPAGTKRGEIFEWLRTAEVNYESPILDVGCGNGKLLHDLHLDGFRKLTGVDPFLEADLRYDNGITVYKRELKDIDGQFQLIMMHHSFEHIPDQLGTLEAAAQCLAPGGHLLIRIPLVSSFAWRHYGVNWVQLDAPRHFYLHTPKSLATVSAQAGFGISRVIYDSKASQFWGSEQFAKDIPHRSERSYAENPKRSIFSRREIQEFGRRSRELNQQQDGDAACFFLRRTSHPS